MNETIKAAIVYKLKGAISQLYSEFDVKFLEEELSVFIRDCTKIVTLPESAPAAGSQCTVTIKVRKADTIKVKVKKKKAANGAKGGAGGAVAGVFAGGGAGAGIGALIGIIGGPIGVGIGLAIGAGAGAALGGAAGGAGGFGGGYLWRTTERCKMVDLLPILSQDGTQNDDGEWSTISIVLTITEN